METEFIVRKVTDLDDVLYESTSSNIKTSSGSNFDNLDMIFITGEPSTRPWSKSNRNVQILIRMCLRSRKFLFTSSFATETLVYQSATNFDRQINIINGDEGGRITEMPSYSSRIGSLSCQDYFLENSTGDLYTFRNDQQEWSTKTNIGMHSQLAAQTYSTIGKFIIKAPIYRPKNNIEGPNLINSAYVSKNTEVICYIKKQYILHWAFQDMPSANFIAQKKSKWDIHPFSFTNSETTFVSLAESDSGPLIISFGDYIMGCQFEVIPKYFESLIPLKNFIYNKLLMISENKSSKISILNINASVSSAAVMREMMLRVEAKSQRSLNFAKLSGSDASKGGSQATPTKSIYRTFRSSGYAASKKNIGIIVSENAVSKQVIKADSNSTATTNQKRKGQSLHELNSIIKGKQQNKFVKQDESKNLPSFEELLQARLQELGFAENDLDPQDEEEPITQRQVRRFLHPMLNKECLEDQTGWVPGQLTGRERKPAIRVVQEEHYKSHFHKTIKEESSLLKRSTSVLQMRERTKLNSTIFRNSSIFAGDPYKSTAEIMRDHEKKESQKMIGPSKLDFSVSKQRLLRNQSVNDTTANKPEGDPYHSPFPYYFREDKKNNRITQNNFQLNV